MVPCKPKKKLARAAAEEKLIRGLVSGRDRTDGLHGRQVLYIPPAPKRSDQLNTSRHAATEDLNSGPFVGQRSALRGEDFEVSGHTASVAIVRKCE